MELIKYKSLNIAITFDGNDSIKPKESYVSFIDDTQFGEFDDIQIKYIMDSVCSFFRTYLETFNNLPPTDLEIYVSTDFDDSWLDKHGRIDLHIKIVNYYSIYSNNQHDILPVFHFK